MKGIGRGSRLLLACVAASACGDELGPGDWEARVDTVALYSLARAEHQGLPGAFDFVGLRPVVVEAAGATGFWDVAVSERDGDFVLLPPGALEGLDPSAALAIAEETALEDVRSAPRDTASYSSTEPLVLQAGRVYIVRSHLNPNLGACVYFAKLELAELEEATGRVHLAFTRNPFCNDRRLVPPGDD